MTSEQKARLEAMIDKEYKIEYLQRPYTDAKCPMCGRLLPESVACVCGFQEYTTDDKHMQPLIGGGYA